MYTYMDNNLRRQQKDRSVEIRRLLISVARNCQIIKSYANIYEEDCEISKQENESATKELNKIMSETKQTYLHLPYAGINDEAIGVLAEALDKNDTIIDVNLIGNGIGSEGAKALAKTKLKKLNLEKNNIGDEGTKALAKNETFEELDLQENGITDEGVEAFRGNTTLKMLSLFDPGLTNGCTEVLAEIPLTNLSLNTFFTGNNNSINDEGVKNLCKSTTLEYIGVRNSRLSKDVRKLMKETEERNQLQNEETKKDKIDEIRYLVPKRNNLTKKDSFTEISRFC